MGEAEPRGHEVAPTYPVNNVSDLAEHQLNAIDVQVTVMDRKQARGSVAMRDGLPGSLYRRSGDERPLGDVSASRRWSCHMHSELRPSTGQVRPLS